MDNPRILKNFEQTPIVSIVIVCMNNLKNLRPCLDSIKRFTTVKYETLVVAYLFTKENLQQVKEKYPWVTLIESNEIRGFSENNNLALRQAKGKYCFVLNDDTEMKMPVVDRLVESFSKLDDSVAVVSPRTLYGDGRLQSCGRPPFSWKTQILSIMHLYHEQKDKRYCNKEGLFQSYNIVGAAFMIKTQVFRDMGWFNEYYFFTPEDIALSTLLNKKGYKCYVDANINLIHYEGMSGKSLSMIQVATKPAGAKGSLVFYSDGDKCLYMLLGGCMFTFAFMKFVFNGVRSFLHKRPNAYTVLSTGNLRICKTLFSNKTPKEIFMHYYNNI